MENTESRLYFASDYMEGAHPATVSYTHLIVYFCKFRKMYLSGEMLKPKLSYLGAIISLGLASCINQI